MNRLEVQYKDILPGCTKVYLMLDPKKASRHNQYISLLYEGMDNVSVEGMTVYQYPKLFFSRLRKEKAILHHHWFDFHNFKSFSVHLWKISWIIGGNWSKQ